jgi:hypothetical protein
MLSCFAVGVVEGTTIVHGMPRAAAAAATAAP